MLSKLSRTLHHKLIREGTDYSETFFLREKGEDDPVLRTSQLKLRQNKTTKTHCQPLGVVNLAGTEQGLKGVIARDDEASQIGQELTTEVEDDKEEIQGTGSENCIDLRNRSLLLDVVKGRIFGELGNFAKLVSRSRRNTYMKVER